MGRTCLSPPTLEPRPSRYRDLRRRVSLFRDRKEAGDARRRMSEPTVYNPRVIYTCILCFSGLDRNAGVPLKTPRAQIRLGDGVAQRTPLGRSRDAGVADLSVPLPPDARCSTSRPGSPCLRRDRRSTPRVDWQDARRAGARG